MSARTSSQHSVPRACAHMQRCTCLHLSSLVPHHFACTDHCLISACGRIALQVEQEEDRKEDDRIDGGDSEAPGKAGQPQSKGKKQAHGDAAPQDGQGRLTESEGRSKGACVCTLSVGAPLRVCLGNVEGSKGERIACACGRLGLGVCAGGLVWGAKGICGGHMHVYMPLASAVRVQNLSGGPKGWEQ